MIIKVWDKILRNLEDRRAATVLTSIDYAKVLNRLSFQHCLRAFKDHGASDTVIRLLATFLTGRTMSVRVGSTWTDPRQITGGCPQGSILGVFLFNMTTDDLEEGSDYIKQHKRVEVGNEEDDVDFFHAPPDAPSAFAGMRMEGPAGYINGNNGTDDRSYSDSPRLDDSAADSDSDSSDEFFTAESADDSSDAHDYDESTPARTSLICLTSPPPRSGGRTSWTSWARCVTVPPT